jgi:cysteine synthase
MLFGKNLPFFFFLRRLTKLPRVTDVEAVAMSRYLVKHDGLFLGSSTACNLVACVKLAKRKGWTKGQTVVTILYEILFFQIVILNVNGAD